jgi:hypothetical protein
LLVRDFQPLASLLFVPSFFAMMDDAGRFAWRVFGRFVDPDAALGARPSSPEQPLEQGKPEAQT